ncbi:MAG: hypothetical protein NTX05_07580 [Fusobacteria bacterium]|nr:hypothetical protein [Fusobacteriota bacterium]
MKIKVWIIRITCFFLIIECILVASFQWKLAILYCLGFMVGGYAFFQLHQSCEMTLYLDKKNGVAYTRKQFVKRYILYFITLFMVGLFSRSGFEILIFAFGLMSIKFTLQIYFFILFCKGWLKGKKSRFKSYYNNEFLGKKEVDDA